MPTDNVKHTTALQELKAAEMKQRPSVQYQPKLKKDGDQWCVLYGNNIQEGCAGFGDTPQEAMEAFDEAWRGSV